jgi:hypothetical protein
VTKGRRNRGPDFRTPITHSGERITRPSTRIATQRALVRKLPSPKMTDVGGRPPTNRTLLLEEEEEGSRRRQGAVPACPGQGGEESSSSGSGRRDAGDAGVGDESTGRPAKDLPRPGEGQISPRDEPWTRGGQKETRKREWPMKEPGQPDRSPPRRRAHHRGRSLLEPPHVH